MQTGHAIITGGSSGIGLALAGLLSKQGWTLSLIARDQQKLQLAEAQLTSMQTGQNLAVHGYVADVADQSALEQAMQLAIKTGGPPLLLVTSAGIARPGHIGNLSLQDFEELNRTNYLGTVYAVKLALPHMQQQQRGHIVMISSGAGLVGIYGYSAYAPTKFAVRGFAESLRCELLTEGIRVSVVYPPDTDTPQLAAEQETKPAQTRAISGSAGSMTAEAVAASILSGIKRGKFTITPGLSMTLLNRLHSLVGPLLRWYFDRLANRAARQLRRDAAKPD